MFVIFLFDDIKIQLITAVCYFSLLISRLDVQCAIARVSLAKRILSLGYDIILLYDITDSIEI